MISRVAFLSMHTCPLLQPGLGDAGGMNVYVKELAEAMASRGVTVDIFTRRREPDAPDLFEAPEGFIVHHLDAGPHRNIPILEMAQYVEEFADGVVSAIESSGHPDIVHTHYWLSGWAGLIVKRETGLPVAHSFHTLGRVKDLLRRPGEPPESLLRIGAEHDVIEDADCLMASTPFEAEDLILHYGADPAKLCVSPPGINHRLFRPGSKTRARASLGWGDGPIVLFVGRIQSLKGVDISLAAAEELHRLVDGVRLVVIGGPSGPNGLDEYEALRARAGRLRVSVEFLSPVPRTELATYFQAADVLHVPSRSETFGLVVVEAQACGLPVVAARVGGLPHTFEPGRSGLLVEGWGPMAHAEALATVLRDKEGSFSEAALRWGREFSWEATADRVLQAYMGPVEEREKTS